MSAASGGKLTFKQYYGGALTAAGTLWDALLTGSADLGVDQPSYNKGRFPLNEILELPWGYQNAVAASTIVWNAYKKFQPKELEGLTMLYTRSYGHPVIMTNVPIRKLSDLKGLRIRGTGNMSEVISALGAAPVSMPIFEVYDAMRKGTIDGCLTGPDNFQNMKLSEVAKYYIDVSFIANGMITTCMMSTNKLNSLPAEYQKIVKDSVDKVNPAYWTLIEKTMTDGYAYADSKGLEGTTISAEDQAQAQTLARQVADKYVSASPLSNAKDVVAFIQDAIKNYK